MIGQTFTLHDNDRAGRTPGQDARDELAALFEAVEEALNASRGYLFVQIEPDVVRKLEDRGLDVTRDLPHLLAEYAARLAGLP